MQEEGAFWPNLKFWTEGLSLEMPIKLKKPTKILEEKQDFGQTLKGTVYVECSTARSRITQAVKLRQLKCWGGKQRCQRTKHICDFELNIMQHFQKNKCLQCILKTNPLQNKFLCSEQNKFPCLFTDLLSQN